MFIIQTNRTITDFQSYMYEIKNQTWEEFKEYIISNEDFTSKIVNLIYDNFESHVGRTKSKNATKVNINDEKHLQVEFANKIISEYMLVNKVEGSK